MFCQCEHDQGYSLDRPQPIDGITTIRVHCKLCGALMDRYPTPYPDLVLRELGLEVRKGG